MKPGNINFLIVRHSKRRVNVSFENSRKLNVLNKEEIRRYLIDIISKPDTNLELDLEKVEFIDSSIFETLNLVSRIGRLYGSYITLINVNKDLMELIDLVKQFSVFDIKHIVQAKDKQVA